MDSTALWKDLKSRTYPALQLSTYIICCCIQIFHFERYNWDFFANNFNWLRLVDLCAIQYYILSTTLILSEVSSYRQIWLTNSIKPNQFRNVSSSRIEVNINMICILTTDVCFLHINEFFFDRIRNVVFSLYRRFHIFRFNFNIEFNYISNYQIYTFAINEWYF